MLSIPGAEEAALLGKRRIADQQRPDQQTSANVPLPAPTQAYGHLKPPMLICLTRGLSNARQSLNQAV
ncbi:MAG TPA: hypothetical protein VM598_06950, partial [Bdellovibrionota bacterium]|nr:hypothetical protein [Bdellovibrionota bacterium]